MNRYTVAWTHPDGFGGYSTVRASSPIDACRALRYMLPEYAARLRIAYVVTEPVEVAA